MPITIPYIDDFAEREQRDVIFVEFFKDWLECVREHKEPLKDYWKDHKTRNTIIQWLNDNNIGYELTYGRYDPCVITSPYLGGLYIDVPYDENNPNYKKVQEFLEYPDGTPKFENVYFYYMPFEMATMEKDRDYMDPDWNP